MTAPDQLERPMVTTAITCDAIDGPSKAPCDAIRYSTAPTARQARQEAAVHGWTTSPAGSDLCPKHSDPT